MAAGNIETLIDGHSPAKKIYTESIDKKLDECVVTTKRTSIVSIEEIAQGKVIEIPDIDQIIEKKR